MSDMVGEVQIVHCDKILMSAIIVILIYHAQPNHLFLPTTTTIKYSRRPLSSTQANDYAFFRSSSSHIYVYSYFVLR